MRKTPYMVSLFGLFISLTLTLISLSLPFWLHVSTPEDVPSVRAIDYGLYKKCELRIVPESGTTSSNSSYPLNEVSSSAGQARTVNNLNRDVQEYTCQTFPARSTCERDGEAFCIIWSAGGYASQLSIVLATAALVALTLANITTHARRRTAWKIVSSLVGFRAVLQILTMAVVVQLLRSFPANFAKETHFSISFWLNITSWILDVFLVVGLVVTGIYAEKGHRWAAGRRPYQPIP